MIGRPGIDIDGVIYSIFPTEIDWYELLDELGDNVEANKIMKNYDYLLSAEGAATAGYNRYGDYAVILTIEDGNIDGIVTLLGKRLGTNAEYVMIEKLPGNRILLLAKDYQYTFE